jgi:hypothetical protein
LKRDRSEVVYSFYAIRRREREFMALLQQLMGFIDNEARRLKETAESNTIFVETAISSLARIKRKVDEVKSKVITHITLEEALEREQETGSELPKPRI